MLIFGFPEVDSNTSWVVFVSNLALKLVCVLKLIYRSALIVFDFIMKYVSPFLILFEIGI